MAASLLEKFVSFFKFLFSFPHSNLSTVLDENSRFSVLVNFDFSMKLASLNSEILNSENWTVSECQFCPHSSREHTQGIQHTALGGLGGS